MTLEQVSEQTDLAKSTLSRIETAQISARTVIVRALLDLYGVTGPDADALIRLAREVKQRGWWQSFSDVVDTPYGDYIGLESEATHIRNYEPMVIPGLLQTPEYSAALYRLARPPMDEMAIKRRVDVRSARQHRLGGDRPVEFHAILEASALRRPLGGPDVMQRQLRHLAELAVRDNVTIQLVPAQEVNHPALIGGFSVLRFADPEHHPDVAYVEFASGQVFLEAKEDVGICSQMFHELSKVSLDSESSLQEIFAASDMLRQ